MKDLYKIDNNNYDPNVFDPNCNNTVKLVWNASLDANNTPNPIVRGYKIHIGNTSNVYRTVIDKPLIDTHPMELEHQITGLTAGDFYFVVTAYSADQSSGYSNEVTTTFYQCVQTKILMMAH